MDEHSLRSAFTEAMNSTPTPPEMDGERVLHDARQAKRAHRAKLAGFASAAAVVVVAAGAFALPVLGGGVADSVAVGSTRHPTQSQTGSPDPTATETKPTFPSGQSDRTETSGPQDDRSKVLLTRVLEVVPPGYTAPEQFDNPDSLPARDHQAQVVDDHAEVWEYLGYITVGKGDGRWGRIVAASVHFGQGAVGCGTEESRPPAECKTIEVGGKHVAVYTGVGRPDQWAVYQHPDGVVVTVTQSKSIMPQIQPLADYPFTASELAALATGTKFTLS
ncbi:hypothetical protein [Actinokineospora globicatena]|uniref:hypothetical protein n=1 Tax=Actinokineospora globicatena TaxID=103729 RepID=UPI0020A3F36D|nr:hypothetical protein [Actinokineospora globicatena]MCP2301604.1 hypothetical protein [Actinokineospora globicatena]GLW76742.1 hypothetical protein Aglo01_12240 [Actinokineospora globicatena]GLW83575.1 hypothetical protein Aglo02_12150 [Actinokineospora globicatena]